MNSIKRTVITENIRTFSHDKWQNYKRCTHEVVSLKALLLLMLCRQASTVTTFFLPFSLTHYHSSVLPSFSHPLASLSHFRFLILSLHAFWNLKSSQHILSQTLSITLSNTVFPLTFKFGMRSVKEGVDK